MRRFIQLTSRTDNVSARRPLTQRFPIFFEGARSFFLPELFTGCKISHRREFLLHTPVLEPWQEQEETLSPRTNQEDIVNGGHI